MTRKKTHNKLRTLSRRSSANNRKERNLFVWVALILLVVSGLVYYVISQNPAKSPSAATRDPKLWPFSTTSPWNMPIGSNAVYKSTPIASDFNWTDEEPIIMGGDRLLTGWNNGGQWPISGDCTGTQLSYKVPVPTGMTTHSATDIGNQANFSGAFLQQDNRTLVEVQGLVVRDNCVALGWERGHHDIQGSGVGRFSGGDGSGVGGHGGSGMSGVGGSVRKWEAQGNDPIRHAVKILLSDKYLSAGNGGYRWPALNADSGYSSRYIGQWPDVRMGALMALNKTLDINSIGLTTDFGKRLAWAFQNYGAYVVDELYGTSWAPAAMTVEYGVNDVLSARYGSDLEGGAIGADVRRIFANLSVISNNDANNVGGGGTPLQPLAPDFGVPVTSASPTPTPQATQQPVLASPIPTPTPTPTQVPQTGTVTEKVASGDPAIGSYAVDAATNVAGDVKVLFFVDGSTTPKQTENEAPYSLFGDTSGVLNKGTLGNGTHNVEARVYAQTGTTVLAKTSINVVEGSAPSPSPSPIAGTFTGNFFNNKTLTGTPVAIVGTPTINYLWTTNAPTSGVNKDNFSARFTRTFDFDGSKMRFNVTADDGVRVLVDGKVVLDGWRDQPATTYNALYTPSKGNHTVVVEYYESGWDAVLQANWVHADTCFDMTGDGQITDADTKVVANHYGTRGDSPWNVSGGIFTKIVDSLDLSIMAKNVGKSCS